MPTNRWLHRLAFASRDIATHAHMRADLLPRLPFVIALVVSAVALVVAVEHRPGTDARVASVAELPSTDPEDYSDEAVVPERQVDLEIVEHGFSKIIDRDGEEKVIVAVVVRNPHDGELVPGSLSILTETKRGYPVNLDTIYIGSIPPFSTASVGYVMTVDVSEVAVEKLYLQQDDQSLLYPTMSPEQLEELEQDEGMGWPGGAEWLQPTPLPVFTLAELQPMASPDGYRVHFRAENAEDTDAQIAVLFRDGDGELLGGLPADSGSEYYSGGYRMFPAGGSDQYVDVREEWIPEEADLDRIEIGPSRY